MADQNQNLKNIGINPMNSGSNNLTQTSTDKENELLSGIEGELKARFELLPKEIQDTITSSDYQMKLFEIAKKHKLTYDKLGQLELETTMVLLGMTPPEEYEEDLSEQLGMKKEELSGLIKDVNDQVFLSIREQLKKVYSSDSTSEKPTPSTSGRPASETIVRAYNPKPEMPQTQTGPRLEKAEASVFTQSGIEIVGQTEENLPTVNQTPKPVSTMNLSDIKKQATSFEIPKINSIKTGATDTAKPARDLPLDIPMPIAPKVIKEMPTPPAQTKTPGIVAEGLGGVVSNPNTTKDYSVPNMTKGAGRDPYREAI